MRVRQGPREHSQVPLQPSTPAPTPPNVWPLWRDRRIFSSLTSEHRRRIVLPSEWEAHPGDGVIGDWVGGLLPEPKYQAFRHDLLVASFHPGPPGQVDGSRAVSRPGRIRVSARVLRCSSTPWGPGWRSCCRWPSGTSSTRPGLEEVRATPGAGSALSRALRRVRVGSAAGTRAGSRPPRGQVHSRGRSLREARAGGDQALSKARAPAWHTLRDASTWRATGWPMLRRMALACARPRWSASWRCSLVEIKDITRRWKHSKRGSSKFARGSRRERRFAPGAPRAGTMRPKTWAIDC